MPTIQRIVFSSFVVGIAVAGLAIPAHAQARCVRRPIRVATTRQQLSRAEIRLQHLVNQLNVMTATARAQARARSSVVLAGSSQPRVGNRAFPVLSCGAVACSKETVDKVNASITLGPQLQQYYNSMPGVPAILR